MPSYAKPKKIVKNGTTYFRCRLYLPFDTELGYKPKPVEFYGKTAREAEAKRDAYDTKASKVPDAAVQFVHYLQHTFLPYEEARYDNGDLSWQRFYNRKSRLTRFVIKPEDPKIEDTKLRRAAIGKLRPAHVEDFMRVLETQGISAYNRDGLYNDIRLVLTHAKRLIPDRVDDYFEDLRRPKIVRKKPKVYDDDTLWNTINNPALSVEDRLFVAFLFIMQCRPSEMFALTWSDIADGQVTFRKAVRRVRDGFAVTDGTKTGEAGVRTLPLGQTLTHMLRTVQKARMASGKPSDWVFHLAGKQLNKDRMRYRWRAVKKSLGLPDGPTFYSLKKSGNSFAARQGVGDEVRAKIMGHTTTRMAKEVYRDVAQAEVVAAIDVFDRRAKGA